MMLKEDYRGLRSSQLSGAQRRNNQSNPSRIRRRRRRIATPAQFFGVRFFVPLIAVILHPAKVGAADLESRHIVMVVLEDVSMRCFENEGSAFGNPTRALDEWAKNHAVTFRHAYANAASCNPSRAALFTCKLPEDTRVFSNQDDWREHGSVIEYLKKEQGYHTTQVDKIFHNSKFPHPESWSETINGKWPRPTRPPVRVIPGPHANAIPMAYGPTGRIGREDADYARAQRAIRVIENFDESGGARLCLMVGLKSTHLPFRYPDDYQRQRKTGAPATAALPGDPAASPEELLKDDAVRQEVVDAYFSCLEYELDCAVEILESARKRFGDNLVMVILSDHGFGLGEKGFWRKCNTNDEATRVPLFISASGLEPGLEIAGPFELARLMPTILDLANVSAYPEAHYPSAVSHIENGWMPPETLAVTYAGSPSWKVVRNSQFALHRFNGIDTLTDLDDGRASRPEVEALLRASFGGRGVAGDIEIAERVDQELFETDVIPALQNIVDPARARLN